MPKMNCPSCRKELSIEGKMQMRFCPYCGCGLDWRQAIFNENITNARAFLNAGKYKEAIPCYNKVLSIEPKNIEALLGVVLAECKVTSLESFYLDESTYQIDTTQSYQKLMDNAPAELKNRVYKAVWAAKERAFAPMLEKARVMLLEEKWDYALKIYTVIDTLSPKEVAQGKLLAELKVRCRQELGKSSKQFATNRLYRSLYELSTEKEKRELKGYVAESCEAVLALAREQKNNGDFENALDNCRYILSINPEHQGALYVALLAEANAQAIEEIDKKELLSSKYYTALSALSEGGLKDTLNSVKKSAQNEEKAEKKAQRQAKKMSKKKRITLLCVLALILVVGASIFIYWTVHSSSESYIFGAEEIEGGCAITEFNDNGEMIVNGHLTIPEEIDGMKVLEIRSSAFEQCTEIETVTIPHTVTSIGYQAFYYCKSLKSVTLPSSVTSIGESAFSGCYMLEEVNLSENIVTIGDNAFLGCYNLTSIKLPSSVKFIGSRAFSGCDRLEKIDLGTGVNTIGSEAFYGCFSLKEIVLPISIEKIEHNAFSGCKELKIYCEAGEKPNEWHYKWNPDSCEVEWGYIK